MTAVSSGHIYARLAERYSLKDGWVTMREVQPYGCSRRMDALSIMLWGSRGFEAVGFEIKVNRGDWLRELSDVAKAEPLIALCTRWWICAPPGVVEKSELPDAWGLLVVHEKRIVAAKQAPRLSPEPWSPEQWRCMMLRAVTRRECEPSEVERARDKGYAEGYAAGKQQAESFAAEDRRRLKDLKEKIYRAEAATGVQINSWMDYPALGLAMKALSEHHGGISHLAYEMAEAAATLRELAAALNVKKEAAE